MCTQRHFVKYSPIASGCIHLSSTNGTLHTATCYLNGDVIYSFNELSMLHSITRHPMGHGIHCQHGWHHCMFTSECRRQSTLSLLTGVLTAIIWRSFRINALSPESGARLERTGWCFQSMEYRDISYHWSYLPVALHISVLMSPSIRVTKVMGSGLVMQTNKPWNLVLRGKAFIKD